MVLDRRLPSLLCPLVCFFTGSPALAETTGGECEEWQTKQPAWIWCDDFESDAPLSARYGEANIAAGPQQTLDGPAHSGRGALQLRYQGIGLNTDHVNPGHIRRNFGRAPFPNTHRNRGAPPWFEGETFTTIHYRYFHLLPSDFEGWPDKYSRAFVVHEAGPTPWNAQTMIAHVWWIPDAGRLGIDPASAINPAQPFSPPSTTAWNDFHNLFWLNKGWPSASRYGSSPLNKGQWHCVEVRVQLNTPQEPFDDGEFQLWIDGVPQISQSRQRLYWRGAADKWGINGIQLESYWNRGSPRTQSRYFDDFVISREPIGC